MEQKSKRTPRNTEVLARTFNHRMEEQGRPFRVISDPEFTNSSMKIQLITLSDPYVVQGSLPQLTAGFYQDLEAHFGSLDYNNLKNRFWLK